MGAWGEIIAGWKLNDRHLFIIFLKTKEGNGIEFLQTEILSLFLMTGMCFNFSLHIFFYNHKVLQSMHETMGKGMHEYNIKKLTEYLITFRRLHKFESASTSMFMYKKNS